MVTSYDTELVLQQTCSDEQVRTRVIIDVEQRLRHRVDKGFSRVQSFGMVRIRYRDASDDKRNEREDESRMMSAVSPTREQDPPCHPGSDR